uniref:Eukaryotic translation initiation factor 3 subunit C n=1 Tax=Salmo salar TaxID=8030 RepID=B9EP36_SALSA|nr:Eukaryotic translation initiation factor 3 subunit C [Salmo salar]
MSRFFATGSDSESEDSSLSDEITPKVPGTSFTKQSLLLRDDEEDTKRVVRSAKDKRFEELTNLIKTIRNAMKIRDMSKCLEEFEQLCRAFLKSKTIVDKEGMPPFYIRLLSDLEDYLNQLWEDKEGKKKMNKNNAKALSTLRQKIRKYNRDYETEIASYKENPMLSADEEDEKDEVESGVSSDSDDEPGDAKSFLKKKPAAEALPPDSSKFLKGAADEESSSSSHVDDEDWDSDTAESGSGSEDEEGNDAIAKIFLKKSGSEVERHTSEKKKEDRKKRHKRKERVEEEAEEEAQEEDEGKWEKVKGGVPLVKMFAKGTEPASLHSKTTLSWVVSLDIAALLCFSPFVQH